MSERREEWLAAIAESGDEAQLKELETSLVGKNGAVTALVKGVSKLPKEERREAGQSANRLKQELAAAIEARRGALRDAALTRELSTGEFDPTAPGLEAAPQSAPGRDVRQPIRPARGTLHPITSVRDELVDLFASLGFAWEDGPEIETERFNFEDLNIPADHPARDSQDTFWLREQDASGRPLLLRTHTSPVQVRTMLTRRPPLKVIVPGRCFRQEDVDASHEHTFYQMEGLVVDKGVSTANLIHTMKTCLREILRREVKVRLRPGFFPFVEPGFELDVNCPFCGGETGCSVCKQSGWIEILPCGMVHPNVLRAGGIDPEEYTGFAFGMGLQRVVMLRYGIDDIRLFTGGDVRFLRQFGEIGR